MKNTIRHTGIVVNDLDKAIDFWCGLLGFNVIKETEESGTQIDRMLGTKNVKLSTKKLSDSTGHQIELLKFHTHFDKKKWVGKAFSIGLTHIAINVSKLDDLYILLTKEGYAFNAPPHESPDGLVKVAYMHGPEGLLIELVEEKNNV